MKRRKCIAVIIVSAIAGVGTSVSAAEVIDSRTSTDDTALVATKLTPIPTKDKKKADDKPKAQGGQAKAPTPTKKPEAPGVDYGNLLQWGELTTADFPLDGSTSSNYEGDGQYPISPCFKTGLGAVTGRKVLTTEHRSTNDQAVVESVTSAPSNDEASRMAQTVVDWHNGTCGPFSAGPQNRYDVAGGYVVWVDLSQEQEAQEFVAIIKVGNRIGVVDGRLAPYSEQQRNAIFNAAASRMQ